MELLTYLLTGACAGLLAGLLGVGGGLVIVPVLAILFSRHGIADTYLMHLAIGTSLACIIPTSIVSLLAHHRHGSVNWLVVSQLIPGIVTGALAGAWLARQFSSAALALVFGSFALLVSLQIWFGLRPAAHRALPGQTGMMLAGGIIGSASSLLGIGGGTMTTPFLLWNGLDIRHAVGSSAACGLPIALTGTAGFVMTGILYGEDIARASGFVYWPAVAGIVVASMVAAPLGARLAYHLPRPVLQRLFALFLLTAGLKLLFQF